MPEFKPGLRVGEGRAPLNAQQPQRPGGRKGHDWKRIMKAVLEDTAVL